MRARALWIGLCAVTFAVPSLADNRNKQCVEATERGQAFRDDGKLSAARDQFLACSSDKCPSVIAKQCLTWLQQVRQDQPTVSFRAKDSAGKDILDVRILIDGVLAVETLDGKPLDVDPGVHAMRYVHAGSPDVEDKVVVRLAEKNRLVDVTFSSAVVQAQTPVKDATPPSQPSTSGGFHVPVVSWITGIVGVGAFATMAGLAVSANSDESALRSSCAPRCAQGDVDAIQTKLLIANVAMVVGIVSLGVMVTTLVVANIGSKQPKTGGSQVRVQAGAGWLGVAGTF